MMEAPITITLFSSPRSAGGLHDFFSEGDYWWPDPKDTSAPYIQRDGMTNPENFTAHRSALMRLSVQVPALVAAFHLTGKRSYAEHAMRHLRAWFVADATRMNPHLLYAQAIKGRATGRGIGIIDTIHLVEVAKSIEILIGSSVMSADDSTAIVGWFAEYLRWMSTHQYGHDEQSAKNNHGTCWVFQAAAFAHLAGDTATIAFCRKRFKEVLIPEQMAADGSFPLELKRTKPYSYSLFNLEVLGGICQLLSSPADNLWTFTLPDGRSMSTAVSFLFPFIKDKSTWPYAKDVMYWEEWPVRQSSLLFAGNAYGEQRYFELWKTLKSDPTQPEVIRNFPIRQPILWLKQ
ncbi:MAG: alginate lyase family protein [Ignavibacteriales bacterium]|nr:alginate lyase family protein [Ignavibacteriales bacterium]